MVEGTAQVGITTTKEIDFSGWYQQVLTKGDMLDYYDISGCYILKVCFRARTPSCTLTHSLSALVVLYLGEGPEVL